MSGRWSKGLTYLSKKPTAPLMGDMGCFPMGGREAERDPESSWFDGAPLVSPAEEAEVAPVLLGMGGAGEGLVGLWVMLWVVLSVALMTVRKGV